ncbi:uncharacterized protein LOC133297716 [Gastrolobium bilobum]|uniref:uncharacterized protein LOC133297716 n=1 Tax=Gastrolobium bilobum TaxID=150636 RepID=UPI002AB1ACE0|nr:uncharacterized protein LOC133297716 [Gastrolobium bilobum]
MRRVGSEGTSNEALVARGRSGDRSKSGHRGRSRGRSKSRDKSDKYEMRCWRCKQVGHLRRNCISKSVGPEKRDDSQPSASGIKKDDDDSTGDLYMAFDSHSDCNDWIIDTGASFHMTPHREWFCTYESYSGGTVRMGDDTTHAIVGRGKVKLKMSDGTVKNLPGVMYIPGLTRNLISVGTMADAVRDYTLKKAPGGKPAMSINKNLASKNQNAKGKGANRPVLAVSASGSRSKNKKGSSGAGIVHQVKLDQQKGTRWGDLMMMGDCSKEVANSELKKSAKVSLNREETVEDQDPHDQGMKEFHKVDENKEGMDFVSAEDIPSSSSMHVDKEVISEEEIAILRESGFVNNDISSKNLEILHPFQNSR